MYRHGDNKYFWLRVYVMNVKLIVQFKCFTQPHSHMDIIPSGVYSFRAIQPNRRLDPPEEIDRI